MIRRLSLARLTGQDIPQPDPDGGVDLTDEEFDDFLAAMGKGPAARTPHERGEAFARHYRGEGHEGGDR